MKKWKSKLSKSILPVFILAIQFCVSASPPDSLNFPTAKKITNLDFTECWALKIFSQKMPWYSKAFLFDTSRVDCTTLPRSLEIKPDFRAEIEYYKEELFIVKYKFRESRNFITDTCKLYVSQGICVAFSTTAFQKDFNFEKNYYYSAPASTDERDQIYICTDEKGKYKFFEK